MDSIRAEEKIRGALKGWKGVYLLDYILGEKKFLLYVEEGKLLEVTEILEGLDIDPFKIELKLR